MRRSREDSYSHPVRERHLFLTLTIFPDLGVGWTRSTTRGQLKETSHPETRKETGCLTTPRDNNYTD